MRTYGLIGYPLGHSFSRKFFSSKFENEGKEERYLNFEIAQIGLLPDILRENQDLAGLNVTIPYKTQVIPYMDELDETAAAIGAVNTILVTHTGGKIRLKGFNTDVYGFTESLRPLLKEHHQKALVLGTGGASRAVHYALEKMGIVPVSVSRKKSDRKTLTYGELDGIIFREHHLIINTTPVGTFPEVDSCPGIPYEYITDKHLLFDLVYNPPLTRFLELGKSRGAAVRNGYEMLELQALRSYAIWNSYKD